MSTGEDSAYSVLEEDLQFVSGLGGDALTSSCRNKPVFFSFDSRKALICSVPEEI